MKDTPGPRTLPDPVDIVAAALRRVADRLDATVKLEEQGRKAPHAMIAACSHVSAALRTEADALTG